MKSARSIRSCARTVIVLMVTVAAATMPVVVEARPTPPPEMSTDPCHRVFPPKTCTQPDLAWTLISNDTTHSWGLTSTTIVLQLENRGRVAIESFINTFAMSSEYFWVHRTSDWTLIDSSNGAIGKSRPDRRIKFGGEPALQSGESVQYQIWFAHSASAHPTITATANTNVPYTLDRILRPEATRANNSINVGV